MTDLGTYQIAFPNFTISYPEPQFRTDARPLFDELRAKFLAGMADVYDRHAEIARQKYNAMDPTTERPPIVRRQIVVAPDPALSRTRRTAALKPKKKTHKKGPVKPAAKRKCK